MHLRASKQSGLMLLADKATTAISAHDASGQPCARSREPAIVGSTAARLPASLTAYATGGRLHKHDCVPRQLQLQRVCGHL